MGVPCSWCQKVSPKVNMLFAMTSSRVERKKAVGNVGGIECEWLSTISHRACKPCSCDLFEEVSWVLYIIWWYEVQEFLHSVVQPVAEDWGEAIYTADNWSQFHRPFEDFGWAVKYGCTMLLNFCFTEWVLWVLYNRCISKFLVSWSLFLVAVGFSCS